MPWSTADVDSHKKGLTDKQKAQWVAVANSALAACLKKGGTDKTCAPSAIKQANATVGSPTALEGLDSLKHLMSSLIHRDQIEGEDYYVIPTILIVEGVHTGLDGGATYYPNAELAKFPEAWNGRPVVVMHPDLNGHPITANSPELVEQQTVGNLYHCKFENNKLKGESWIKINKCRKVSPEVMGMLEKNLPIEVSTGLFVEHELKKGVWNNEQYDSTALNYRPDHLALLPGGVGACSWQDGAGMPRLNASGKEEDDVHDNSVMGLVKRLASLVGVEMDENERGKGRGVGGPRQGDGGTDTCVCPSCGATAKHERGKPCTGMSCPKCGAKMTGKAPTVLELSHSAIRDAIRSKFSPAFGGGIDRDVYIVEVFDKYAIYESANKTNKQAYSIDANDAVELIGNPVEVVKEVKYSPVVKGNTGLQEKENKEGGPNMDRKEKVEALIANGSWGKDNREFLVELEDAQFETVEKLSLNQKGEEEGDKKEKKEDKEVVTLESLLKVKPEADESEATKLARNAYNKSIAGEEGSDEGKDEKDEKPQTVEEFIANAPAGMRDTLSRSVKRDKSIKEKLVKSLTDNKRNEFSKEDLEAKSLAELESLVKLGQIEVDFGGQNPDVNAADDEDKAPEMVRMEWGEKKEKEEKK